MQLTLNQKVYHTLRIASAMCFIGHGAWGIITKPIWCNYFAVFGIGHDLAYRLMPIAGTVDILMGIIFLIYPLRVIADWLVVWGTVTALLRPLSGEPFAEFIERAGNFGAPLALLIFCGANDKIGNFFKPIGVPADAGKKRSSQAVTCLRAVAFLLLAGHGWLNLSEKQTLLDQYTAVGFSHPVAVAHIVGSFEVVAACSVIIFPVPPFILVFFIWKMFSELFYPKQELFEWIERGGSYGSLLALWMLLSAKGNYVAKSSWVKLSRIKGLRT